MGREKHMPQRFLQDTTDPVHKKTSPRRPLRPANAMRTTEPSVKRIIPTTQFAVKRTMTSEPHDTTAKKSRKARAPAPAVDVAMRPPTLRNGCKPVQQIDPDTGRIIETFPSGSAASKKTGIGHPLISFALNGKSQLAGGYVWRFATFWPPESGIPFAAPAPAAESMPARILHPEDSPRSDSSARIDHLADVCALLGRE